jgi:hypothetical protein
MIHSTLRAEYHGTKIFRKYLCNASYGSVGPFGAFLFLALPNLWNVSWNAGYRLIKRADFISKPLLPVR